MMRSPLDLLADRGEGQPGAADFGVRHGEIRDGVIEPLWIARMDWTAAEHRVAAAVLGDQAERAVRIECLYAADRSVSVTDYGRGYIDGMDAEGLRHVYNLAREAAHYALRAIEIEQVELHSLGQAVR
jgi:hypothetical protein